MYITILNRLILSHVQSILNFVLGEIAPVGPTSFEFVVPEGAPVTVSPSVGTVLPGKVSQNTVLPVSVKQKQLNLKAVK